MRQTRGQLLCHAVRRPCIRCGGTKGMKPAASAFTGTTDSRPLQDGIRDLSSLHPVTVPNWLTRHTLVTPCSCYGTLEIVGAITITIITYLLSHTHSKVNSLRKHTVMLVYFVTARM